MEWKDITNYEGLYRVNCNGDVYSIRKNKILTPERLSGGYLRVGLFDELGNRKRFLIHRLVLCEFDEYRQYPEWEVNHIDMDTSNNHISNLEWVTQEQNHQHAVENNPTRYDKSRELCSKIGKEYGHLGIEASKKPVLRIDKETFEIIERYESARDASRQGYNYKNISAVCNGTKKTHNGFIWKFEQRRNNEKKI